jgi:hypothetical protein
LTVDAPVREVQDRLGADEIEAEARRRDLDDVLFDEPLADAVEQKAGQGRYEPERQSVTSEGTRESRSWRYCRPEARIAGEAPGEIS